MFNALKIPIAYLIAGIIWALFSDPLITLFTKGATAAEQDKYRSLNDFASVVIVAFVLYLLIKAQQNRLSKSEEEYRQLFESNPNPVWIYNERTLRFVKVNKAAIEKYGYSNRKFMKMTIMDIRPKEDHQKLKEYIKVHENGFRKAGIWKHVKANGEKFDVSVVSNPVLFNDEACNLVMSTDVTELLEKERKLAHAYQKIQHTNELLMEIAWSHSHELRRPLCSIISLVAFLKDATSEQEKQEYVKLLEVCTTELDEVLKFNNEKVDRIELMEAV